MRSNLSFIKTKLFNNQVFQRLLTSYCLILLVPILISWFAYCQAISMVEDYIKDSNVTMLKQSSKIIEKYIEEIHSSVFQIAMNNKLNGIMHDPSVDQFTMMTFLQDTRSYIVTNNFLTRWYIYLKNSDYVIYADTLYKGDLFFEKVFRYNRLSSSQWRKKLFERFYQGEFSPPVSAEFEQTNYSIIRYTQSIPFSVYKQKAEGVIEVLIEEKEFSNLLPQSIEKQGGWVYVLDEKGRRIISSSTNRANISAINTDKLQTEGCIETNILGEKLFVTYIDSSYNGWKYVAVLPSSVVMGKVIYIKIIAWAVTILSLLLGVLAAYFLARRNAAPIRGVIKMLSEFFGIEKESDVGDYEFLHGRISELIGNNQAVQFAMQKQIPFATATFFDHLLKGEFKNDKEVENFEFYIGLRVTGTKFRVVLVRVYESSTIFNEALLKQLDITKYVIKDTLQKLLGQNTLIWDVDENKMVVILGFNNLTDAECEAKTQVVANQIYQETMQRYHVNLFFAIGNLNDDLCTINQSYEQALIASDYPAVEEKNIVWYHDLPVESEDYYYSMEIEQRVMNFTKAGDWEEVERILKNLYKENFQKRHLSLEMLELFLSEVIGTLTKLKSQCYSITLKVQLDQIDKNNSVEKIFQDITVAFASICEGVNEQKRSHNTQLKSKIIRYIEESYSDPALCLSCLAERFGLTESYLSQFFKEQSGENFSGFLENIRMDHAYHLLAENNLSISEIASLVGYNSDQVFRRAFKRVNGISPHEFREQKRGEV